MIQWTINTGNNWTTEMANLLEHAASRAVRDTADIVKLEWERAAKNKLSTTLLDYLAGLNHPESVQFPDPFTAVITLKGKWPNMLESGFPAFDMKQGFQKSDKVRRTKTGGWYMTIPFRHQTPGTKGMGGGTPMPRDIYRQARNLRPGQRLTGTEAKYPPQMSWTGYEHKAGIYEGMTRVQKNYLSGARQGMYFTFRRVSNNSDPLSWWHPGFDGVKAVPQLRPLAQEWLHTTLMYHLADLR